MKLHIKNFRSIKQLDLEIAPITVLYGHNGTGKSSVLYAPLTLKNIVLNPNQHVQEFFNYRFTSLGSFEEVVFNHDSSNELELGISVQVLHPVLGDYIDLEYSVTLLNVITGSFRIKISVPGHVEVSQPLPVSFPYDSSKSYISLEDWLFGEGLIWNGMSADIAIEIQNHDVQKQTKEMLNSAVEELKKVNFVPLGRGFFQPSYSGISTWISDPKMADTEQEVASMIANDRHIRYAISQRLEQILNRNFAVGKAASNEIGFNDFSLDSIDRKSSVSASLVNEGFGVNQLVYMLAKVLHTDAGIVCIEEPEIHLHPSAIRRLARALADIVREEPSKHLIISTHSKQFIMSLLALVAEEAYSPDDLAVYLAAKDEKASVFHRQQVNENGQIEGGFASFIEGELEDMKAFLGV